MVNMITGAIGFILLAMHISSRVNGQNSTTSLQPSATNASSPGNITSPPAASGNASKIGWSNANMTTVPKNDSANMSNTSTKSPDVTTTTVTVTTTTVTMTSKVTMTPQLLETTRDPNLKSASVSFHSSSVIYTLLVGWLLQGCL
ncbi:hypothetical protein UPYG_G00225200 [Umbra pygmaea]|uniref:Uncharacterized protein n=1 Tax=Umbra pygmaea TaxID=75934 RepID=A0ABD0WUL2_UMBPY